MIMKHCDWFLKSMHDKNPETRRKIEKNREPNMVL